MLIQQHYLLILKKRRQKIILQEGLDKMKIDAELEDLNEALLQMSSQVLENLKKL